MQYSHTLLTFIALIDAVAIALGDLWASDPALAQQVRRAGTGVALSLAVARFARTRRRRFAIAGVHAGTRSH